MADGPEFKVEDWPYHPKIASVFHGRGWAPRTIATATAHLIASAPDLYEALKAMVDRWEPDCAGTDRLMWEKARAALALADGEIPPC
jgi:hypothetical protein